MSQIEEMEREAERQEDLGNYKEASAVWQSIYEMCGQNVCAQHWIEETERREER